MRTQDKKTTIVISLIIIITLLLIISLPAKEVIRWPVNLAKRLSATLGEIRGYSLHQGLDIKTKGRTGYPVYAAARGKLSRLISKERGYGNAVFLDHSKNRQTVYGHLEVFEDRYYNLNIVAMTLKNLYNVYNLDFTFHNKKYVYKKNTKIGLTGESGSGMPHLHFELRKGKKYINPLKYISIPDKKAPVIDDLFLCIEKEFTTVYERRLKVRSRKGKYSLIEDPVKIAEGEKLFFKISCYDNVGAENKVAVYSLRLLENNKKIFERTFDHFKQSELGNGRSVYDISKSKIKGGVSYAYFLCDREEIRLKKEANTGYINAKSKANSYSIIVSDFAGNRSTIKFKTIKSNGKIKYNKNYQLLKKDRRHSINNNKDLSLTVYRNSLYNKTLILPGAYVSPKISKTVRSLAKVRRRDVLKIVSIKPFDHVYKSPIKISIRKPDWVSAKDCEHILIYRFFEGSNLRLLNTTFYPGKDVFEAFTKTNGYFVLLRDKVPPKIYLPPTHEFYIDHKYYRNIRFYTSENVSKIDARSIECIIDGESFPFKFDSDRKWIEITLLKESIIGNVHHVFIKVCDKAGNPGYFRDLLIFNQ